MPQDPGVRGADDAAKKFQQREYVHKGPVQSTTLKMPAEQDIQPTGLQPGTAAHPTMMTMADHDHGIVWPPPKGHPQTPFMGMVKEPVPHKDSVQGVMIGYKGHVPRARDKIGACPLGGVTAGRSQAGFPSPDETIPAVLPAFGAQTSHADTGEHPLYVSVAQAHATSTVMALSGLPPPNRPTQAVNGNGYIPRYGGHKPGTYDKIGGSTYGGAPEGRKTIAPSTFEWQTAAGRFNYGRATMNAPY